MPPALKTDADVAKSSFLFFLYAFNTLVLAAGLTFPSEEFCDVMWTCPCGSPASWYDWHTLSVSVLTTRLQVSRPKKHHKRTTRFIYDTAEGRRLLWDAKSP